MPLAVKIILIVLAALIVVPVIVIGIFMLLSPISDNMDKSKFEKLDSQSREIFSQVKAAAGDKEVWMYKAECTDIFTGDWPTGEYNCKTTISMEALVTTPEEVRTLHNKYYAIIESSYYLKPKMDLKMRADGDFGVNFVISSAEKDYFSTVDDTVGCRYTSELSHTGDKFNALNYGYGTPIAGTVGTLIFSFRCSDKARSDWYPADI